jgi:hypothetical protein
MSTQRIRHHISLIDSISINGPTDVDTVDGYKVSIHWEALNATVTIVESGIFDSLHAVHRVIEHQSTAAKLAGNHAGTDDARIVRYTVEPVTLVVYSRADY